MTTRAMAWPFVNSVTGALEEGLLGVSQRYQVITSKALTAHNNIAGHLLTLHERPLVTPDALRWHGESSVTPSEPRKAQAKV